MLLLQIVIIYGGRNMILKQERVMTEVYKSVPEIGVPFKGVEEKAPSRFYKYDPSLSQVVAGYQQGSKNPYVEKLMKM